MQLQEITTLITKELVLEWRRKHTLGGILLYLVSTIFICYLSFAGIMNAPTWNALFWIIMAFASLNLVLKSFSEESDGRKLYFYALIDPGSLIISKIIYNALVMIFLGTAGFLVFSMLMGNMATNMVGFFVVLITGVTGFSAMLTMVSAIAGQARNNFTLMAILGFPLLLPLLLLLIKASLAAIDGQALTEFYLDIVLIVLLVFVAVFLSRLLFPFLWKE